MSRFSKHKWWLLTVGLTAPLFVLAGPVPNTFVPGTAISSQQVNDNFKNLSDRLDRHAARRVGYAMILPTNGYGHSFSVSSGLQPFINADRVGMRGTPTPFPDGISVYGAVHLPHGSHVTAVRCYAYDNSNANFDSPSRVAILATPVATGVSVDLYSANFQTTNMNGDSFVDLQPGTLALDMIDNENAYYFLWVDLYVNVVQTGALWFRGCSVKYETAALE